MLSSETLISLSLPPGLIVTLTLFPSWENSVCAPIIPPSPPASCGVWVIPFVLLLHVCAAAVRFFAYSCGPHSWHADKELCVLVISLYVQFLVQTEHSGIWTEKIPSFTGICNYCKESSLLYLLLYEIILIFANLWTGRLNWITI